MRTYGVRHGARDGQESWRLFRGCPGDRRETRSSVPDLRYHGRGSAREEAVTLHPRDAGPRGALVAGGHAELSNATGGDLRGRKLRSFTLGMQVPGMPWCFKDNGAARSLLIEGVRWSVTYATVTESKAQTILRKGLPEWRSHSGRLRDLSISIHTNRGKKQACTHAQHIIHVCKYA